MIICERRSRNKAAKKNAVVKKNPVCNINITRKYEIKKAIK